MRVEIADGAIHFSENRNRLPTLQGTAQPRRDVGKLLADCRGTCGLTVSTREHRQIRIAMRELRELNRYVSAVFQRELCAPIFNIRA